jgi:hypothetical protein
VGDDEPGTPAQFAGERRADLTFGHRVQAGHRVVQDEQALSLREGAGQADPLPFPAGHRRVGEWGQVSARQAADEVVRTRRPGGRAYAVRLRGAGTAERDGLGERGAVEAGADQDGPFERVTDGTAQRAARQLGQRHPVQQHHPADRVGDPAGQRGEQ